MKKKVYKSLNYLIESKLLNVSYGIDYITLYIVSTRNNTIKEVNIIKQYILRARYYIKATKIKE